MGAYTGVQNCFNEPLVEMAILLKYDGDNILILEGDENALKKNYLQTYNNLLSCSHHADFRTPIEYGRDLVASWIFEDTFLLVLNKSCSFNVELDGADRNRKILPNIRTSTSSDYLIQDLHGNKRKLELMTDYTGYWAKTGKLHLRDAKFQNLQNNYSLFIAVSTISKNFTIYDFKKQINAKYIPSHDPYGGKHAYELEISTNEMIPYTPDNIISAINANL